MSSKDLLRGFLLAHKAPQEILSALETMDAAQTDAPASLPNEIKGWETLSMRTFNCLYRSGITTLEQLLTLSESDLLGIPNFGRKSLNELKSSIKPKTFPPHSAGKWVYDTTSGEHKYVYTKVAE